MIDKATAVEGAKRLGDWLSVGTVAGAMFQWVTPAAALVAMLYTIARFTETDTCRAILFKLFRFDIAKWRKIDEPPA